MRRALVVLGTLLALGSAAPSAFAQQTTGTIGGQVLDPTTGQPVIGATVVASGPQGEEGTITDESGSYTLASLPIGTYVVRFFPPGAGNALEQPGVIVSAGKTLRVNMKMKADESPTETVVVETKAPAVDVGTSQSGLTLDPKFVRTAPLGRTFGETLLLSPTALPERSGNISIGGASGLENQYIVDGLNVTGIEYGDLFSRRAAASGGTNLVLDFLQEIQVNTGGYSAEFGGAMGGVVNVVTKSGSNDYKGSAFIMGAPSAFYGSPDIVRSKNTSLAGRSLNDGELDIGAEVGGPIVRDKLFFWAGFAPQYRFSHFERSVEARVDSNGDGQADVDANGKFITRPLPGQTASIDQNRRVWNYGGKVTYLPHENHRLNLGLFGTPSFTKDVGDRDYGIPADTSIQSALHSYRKENSDLTLNYTGHFFDRKWRIDAIFGRHSEFYRERSPYRHLNQTNFQEWRDGSLFALEGIGGCAPDPVTGFNPCPVGIYRTGGYGLQIQYDATRYQGDIKSTHMFSLFGHHELKYGVRLEAAELELTRSYSGSDGGRALYQNFGDGSTTVWTLFSLPPGTYPFQFAMDPSPLGKAPYYQDQLNPTVKSQTTAAFAQDSWSPLSNLTFNVGLRYEKQKVYDYRDNPFADLDNLGVRAGAVYDPTNEGRSKVYANYGRFFEAMPLNLAARYFGGEGILQSFIDRTSCNPPIGAWTGRGREWEQNCAAPGGYFPANNGSVYPVQPKLRGQFHDEIVAGGQYEVLADTVLGLNFTHRWLGNVIEDGTTAPDFTFVLANPGNVPDGAIKEIEKNIEDTKRAAEAATDPMQKAVLMNELGALESKLANVQGLAKAPKPQRTYTALTLSANRRFTRNLSFYAAYTYSRLIGNYNGLYDPDNNYFAPNGGNFYDTPELMVNRKGPLANDRPHSVRASGFYEANVGPGTVIGSLTFAAFSGVPRNYQASLIPGQPLVFLLPRGSAGRTPTLTQLDGRIAYRQNLGGTMSAEVFFELYNILNTKTALRQDDDYTYDIAMPIENGSVADLAYAKNISGQPLTLNPNFGQAVARQMPIHGRIGLRVLF